MKTALNVLFKKMQKDDKKEVLVFQVNGDELAHAQTLVELAGGIVVMNIDGCEAGDIMAEFASLQRDSKKTALKFNVKGDSEEKAIKLYPYAGRNVTLNLQASQMSLDDYYGDEPREGIEYTVDGNGNVIVKDDPDQVTIDEANASESGKITDLEAERNKRKKKEDEASPDSHPADEDALPF
ncbi:MAG: hypothetical protein J7559_17990 [Cohnella sp.]|nr:hypothetical protein [Cohnella sp.]